MCASLYYFYFLWSKHLSISQTVVNLGVGMDASLSLESHINAFYKFLFLQLQRISHIRPCCRLLPPEKILSAFVLFRLDYCNSPLVSLPDRGLDELQREENKAVCTVFRRRNADHAKVLCKLQWLPIPTHTDEKIATQCYCCLHGLCPAHTSEVLAPSTGVSLLCSFSPMTRIR